MGGFHIAQNFLGAMGHLMKETGLEDMLVEANVCLRGTANKLMAGKDYYAMLKAHSMIHAAMFDLHWEAFEKWLVGEGKDIECISLLASNVQLLLDAISENDAERASSLCPDATDALKATKALMVEFDKICTSPTSKLWLMHMDMLMILKRFIHAERAGLWEAHLAEVEKMLSYLVAAGHYKYVSCLPHYLEAMRALPTVAPSVARSFGNGQFTVRQTSGKFNGVWTDMALEKTYNRDGKTKLFTGICQNPAAMEKYLRALPFMTAVSEQTKAMAHLDQHDKKHHEDSESLAIKDAALVKTITSIIKEKMINPFSSDSTELLNISTGQKAASNDLVNARERGLAALATAQETSSEKVEPVKLNTFVTKSKKLPSAAAKARKLYEEESTVVRNLYFVQDLNEERKMDAFSHEWTSYPASLFEQDASLDQCYVMRKGNKSDFLIALKTSIGESGAEYDILPPSDEPTVLVVDAMAFIQRYQQMGSNTFCDLQRNYLKKLLYIKPAGCNCIHFIGDRYDVNPAESLKCEERDRRQKAHNGTPKEYQPHDALAIPDWKILMQHPLNNANLLRYIGESWVDHHDTLPEGIAIVLGGVFGDPGCTVFLTTDSVYEITELKCKKHEEADTRMFAHIAHCVEYADYKRVIVMATDTDVTMMCIYYSVRLPGLKELWLHKMDKYIPTHQIALSLAIKFDSDVVELTSVLLSAYIITGCDTVSYPYRRGKRRAYKLATENVRTLLPLAKFGEPGESLDVTEEIINAAREYFKALYNRSDFGGMLDALRAHLFANTKGDLRCLPPTEDAFHLHVLRSLHQMVVCKQAKLSVPLYPCATDFGRHIVNDKLVTTMMTKEPKPKEFKEKYCHCKKSKCLKGCLCARANVKCAIACLCSGDPHKCARVEVMLHDDSD